MTTKVMRPMETVMAHRLRYDQFLGVSWVSRAGEFDEVFVRAVGGEDGGCGVGDRDGFLEVDVRG